MSEPERTRIASHVDGCPLCRGRIADLRRLRALLRGIAVRAAQPEWTGFWPGIVRGIEEGRRTAVAAPRPRWRPRLAFGGALAAALIASFTAWELTRGPIVPAASVVVSSADTEHPEGTVMVYTPPEHDLAVVWVFGVD